MKILEMTSYFLFIKSPFYPITLFKGAAPLSGSIKDFTTFGKQNRQKKAHAPFFLALILRYRTDIFQNKKKLIIDLKKKK